MTTHSIIFYQYLFSILILLPIYSGKVDASRIVCKPYHFMRVLLCTVAIVLLNQSFTIMPLAYAVSFNLFSPLLTILAATFWLNEKITPKKCITFLVSVLIYCLLIDYTRQITAPAANPYDYLKPTIALLCFQANTLITKKLFQMGETNIHITLSLIIGIPIFLLPFVLQSTIISLFITYSQSLILQLMDY